MLVGKDLGPLHVEAELGTGAMGTVYKAFRRDTGQWVAVTSKEGGFFLGIPWFLDGVQGTLEEKLKAFTWQNMQQQNSPRQNSGSRIFNGAVVRSSDKPYAIAPNATPSNRRNNPRRYQESR